MANHLHKQIRDALVAALTGLATTTTHVYANRLQSLADTELPSLLITLDEEQATVETIGPFPLLQRDLTAVITAVGKATSALDDTLDQISMEVETRLSAGITVGSRVLDVFYTGMNFDDELSDKPVGIKRMTFTIPYTAMSNAPDVLS